MGAGKGNAGGTCNGLASHPGRNRHTPICFMSQKPEIVSGLMGHLARMQTLHVHYIAVNSQLKQL